MSRLVDELQELQARRFESIGRYLGGAFRIFNDRAVAKIQAKGHPKVGVSQSAFVRTMNVGGTRITELAKRAGMTRQGMGQLVREMEGLGYVTVVADPSDGRAKIVHYTKKGLQLARDAFRSVTEVEEEFTTVLGARKMAKLRELLSELVDGSEENETLRKSWFSQTP